MTALENEPGKDTGDYPGTPRWVKVLGIIVAIPVLLFVIVMLTGGPGSHGPARHLRPDSEAASPPTDSRP